MFKNTEVLIAGHALWEFGAKMVAFPTFTTDVDSAVFQGLERSSMQLLHLRQAGQHMDCEIDYFGTLEERTKRRGALEAILLTAKEPLEIDIGDGYFYRAVPEKIGRVTCDNNVFTEAEYRFRVTRHTRPVQLEIMDGEFHIFCQSTVPLTDCSIFIPQSAVSGWPNLLVDMNRLSGNGMAFYLDTAPTGDVVLDGVRKTFRMGSQTITNSNGFSWSAFPALIPGDNQILLATDGTLGTLTNYVQISYTPTYL